MTTIGDRLVVPDIIRITKIETERLKNRIAAWEKKIAIANADLDRLADFQKKYYELNEAFGDEGESR